MKQARVPGPLEVVTRFPGWRFQMKMAKGGARVIAGRRREQRVILAVDRWDQLAVETLTEMVKAAEKRLK
jgi:hypothetical protein